MTAPARRMGAPRNSEHMPTLSFPPLACVKRGHQRLVLPGLQHYEFHAAPPPPVQHVARPWQGVEVCACSPLPACCCCYLKCAAARGCDHTGLCGRVQGLAPCILLGLRNTHSPLELYCTPAEPRVQLPSAGLVVRCDAARRLGITCRTSAALWVGALRRHGNPRLALPLPSLLQGAHRVAWSRRAP